MQSLQRTRCDVRSARLPQRRTVLRRVLQQDPPPLAGNEIQRQVVLRQLHALVAEKVWQDVEEGVAPPPVEAPVEAKDIVTYFSYGANMNRSTLVERGVRVMSRDAAMVASPSVHMVFKHRGGYATLEERTEGTPPSRFAPLSDRVHGVLYTMPRADLERLSRREGGYRLQNVEVETYDGKRVVARAFVSDPSAKLPVEVKPTERYMRLLRDGAGDNYLHPLHQAWLAGIETVTGAGLPAEYFNTPTRYTAYAFLALSALVVAGFFFMPHGAPMPGM